MHKGLWCLLVTSALCACAPIQPELLNSAMAEINVECSAQKWATAVDQIHCYDKHEIWAWTKYAPSYIAYYRAIQTKRDALAQEFDAHAITSDQFVTQFTAFKTDLYAQLNKQIAADAAQQKIDAANDARLAQALLAGVATYYQARANADAATLRSLQQNRPTYPTMQDTTCQRNVINPSEVNCTTMNY